MSNPVPWHVVQARIAARIADLHTQLEKVAPEGVRHLQGQIAGLRYIEALPLHLSDTDQKIGDSAQT